jgi:hypothetical protein
MDGASGDRGRGVGRGSPFFIKVLKIKKMLLAAGSVFGCRMN